MELQEPFKKDKFGLYYINSRDVHIKKFQFNGEVIRAYENRRDFYRIEGIPDYIIKDTTNIPWLFNTLQNKIMLMKFMEKEGMVDGVDFPVGYFKDKEGIKLIVPLYEGANSIRELIKVYKFEELKDFYNHKEDEVENLISMCLDVLDLVERMFDANIVYRDIAAGNFVIHKNTVKVIDFEPGYVLFPKKKDKYYENLLHNYAVLVDYIWRHYGFKKMVYDPGKTFDEERRKVKSLINKRRG